MKNILPTLFIFAALSGLTSAKELHFPEKGDALFTINIPNSWEPDKDDDNVLEATSDEGHIYLAAWELKNEGEAKALAKDIEDILKDHAKDIKMDGEPQECKPGGLDGLLFKGHAKDKEDDSKIEFFALLIGSKEKAAIIYIEAAEDTPVEDSAKLEKILKSIKPGKGE